MSVVWRVKGSGAAWLRTMIQYDESWYVPCAVLGLSGRQAAIALGSARGNDIVAFRDHLYVPLEWARRNASTKTQREAVAIMDSRIASTYQDGVAS